MNRLILNNPNSPLLVFVLSVFLIISVSNVYAETDLSAREIMEKLTMKVASQQNRLSLE